METADRIIPALLGLAVLLPLISFWIILAVGRWMGKAGEYAAYLAAAAIVAGFGLSLISAFAWFSTMPDHGDDHAAISVPFTAESNAGVAGAEGESGDAGHGHHEVHPSRAITGNWYTLAKMGSLELTIGYYIDSLTIVMFCMVTLIASCIHFYAMGYMHDELHDVTDHEVTLASGEHLHRPGRYHRFFQALSLFCFSMLGLVVAGNVAMTFVFWELVGICSYFLIGFYVERKSASTAANKAFIVNRVGDFGFIIGLMAIWSTMGTFNFGDIEKVNQQGEKYEVAGIFTQVRPEHADSHGHDGDKEHAQQLQAGETHGDDHGDGHGAHHRTHELIVPDGMIAWGGAEDVRNLAINEYVEQSGGENATAGVEEAQVEEEIDSQIAGWSADHDSPEYRWGYFLMIVAGVGIFCGCVGKSAQFPLHTWLPDAMEGPTPVSALVHSATMVAAGVFLVARFYPFFLPEVLLVIAITGCITLFMAATIAIVATDIKRVLAYSTVSQLGYMMLALGVGGWVAGVLHLITHAFFKSLLFMCGGSVIHAFHTNEVPEMGGLIKKMPITGWTMFIGCCAIAGLGIPFALNLSGTFYFGTSGFYSKDAILEQAFLYGRENSPAWTWIFFFAALGGAVITAFYMFRMWFMTFTGKPRNEHRYDHAHESPKVMTYPLILLSVFALFVACPWINFSYFTGSAPEDATWFWKPLEQGVESARHIGTLNEPTGTLLAVQIPDEHRSHAADIKGPVTWMAFGTALIGIGLAAAFYWKGYANPAEVRDQFRSIYNFLKNKWWFDELYDFIFVKPVMVFSRLIAGFDRRWIDGFIDSTARCTVAFCRMFDWVIDRGSVDGSVNLLAKWTWSLGSSLRNLQTGHIRQYVMFIVIATVAIFVLLSFFAT